MHIKEIANENLLYGSENSNRGSVSTKRDGMVRKWEGVSKGRAYMYTYGWFMLRFDRKQQNSTKQLSFNKKNKKYEKKIEDQCEVLYHGWYRIPMSQLLKLQSNACISHQWALILVHIMHILSLQPPALISPLLTSRSRIGCGNCWICTLGEASQTY